MVIVALCACSSYNIFNMFIKKYFSHLKQSVSSIDFYIKSIDTPFRNSLLFFITNMIIFGIFSGINTSMTTLPQLKNDGFYALDEFYNYFDSDLEINWVDNQLELNKESVQVYWPANLDYKLYLLPERFAIISNSTLHPNDSESPTSNTSLIYVNKNNFYTLQELEQLQNTENSSNVVWSEYSLNSIFEDVDSYSINKQVLPKIISETKKVINDSFFKTQVIVTIALSILFLISKMSFLIIESIFVFFLFKIYKLNLGFKKVLKLTSNIMVPTAIIDLSSKLLYKDLNFPMQAIAFWTILAFVSFYLKKELKK